MPLTEAQRDRFSLQFLMLDKDSDGRITTDQLGSLLRCWGLCPTEVEVRAAVRLLDPDGVGVIDKNCALDAAESMLQQVTTEEEVREALRILDENGDGFLTTAELRHILVNLGLRLTTEEADEIISDVYVDKEHHVNLEDLLQLLFSNAHGGEAKVELPF